MAEAPSTSATDPSGSPVAALPIEGRHLDAETLDRELEGGPHLLVFLRHFG